MSERVREERYVGLAACGHNRVVRVTQTSTTGLTSEWWQCDSCPTMFAALAARPASAEPVRWWVPREVWVEHVQVPGLMHDPEKGLFHGWCAQCRNPWPCEYRPESALTPPAAAQDRVRMGSLERIADLLSHIWAYGNFRAETWNEREIEKEMRGIGRWPRTTQEIEAGAARAAGAPTTVPDAGEGEE